MTNEYRIIGPPGTGKTTYTARQVARAVDKYGAEKVLVTSFTKAAAVELAGRDLPVHPAQVGTLHAHCYRSLSNPRIAEEETVKDWNAAYPTMALGSTKQNPLDEGTIETVGGQGDELLAMVNRLRSRMVPVERWSRPCKVFHECWESFKLNNQVLDYTDLIDYAYRDIAYAPGMPDVLFVDEAQDLTPLQVALVRKWAHTCDRLLLVGDDDQTLYAFTGASPATLLDPPLPPEQVITLSQSYRVPEAVHRFAVKWVEQCSVRLPKVYAPRPAAGVVRSSTATYQSPMPMVADLVQVIEGGRSAMILASCSYQLDVILKTLRAEGIPYANRYRRKRGDWNPLAPRKGISAAQRVLALLVPHECMGDEVREWTFGELCQWLDWMATAGVWQRGAKKDAESRDSAEAVSEEWLEHWMDAEALSAMWEALEDRDIRELLTWWEAKLQTVKRPSAQYAARVAARIGPGALAVEPRLIVGTIHSVKGGEADVVYLVPDLSVQGNGQYVTHGEARDTVIRQMYVGITRAREELVLLAPCTPQHVTWRN